MNWDAIAAVAETIGSIAIVITIAYLALQIRQSSKLANSTSVNRNRPTVGGIG